MAHKEPENCWEFQRCPEKSRSKCPAFVHKEGRTCWMVAGHYAQKACPRPKDGDVSDAARGLKGTAGSINDCLFKCEWFRKLNPE